MRGVGNPLSCGKGSGGIAGGMGMLAWCAKNYPGGVPRHPFLERRGAWTANYPERYRSMMVGLGYGSQSMLEIRFFCW